MAGENNPNIVGKGSGCCWVLSLLTFSCPLPMEVAYSGPATTDLVPCFPCLWLKQTSGSYLQLCTLGWEIVSSPFMLLVLGVGILLGQDGSFLKGMHETYEWGNCPVYFIKLNFFIFSPYFSQGMGMGGGLNFVGWIFLEPVVGPCKLCWSAFSSSEAYLHGEGWERGQGPVILVCELPV